MIASRFSSVVIPLDNFLVGDTRLIISVTGADHSSPIILPRKYIGGLKNIMLDRFDRCNSTVSRRDDCLLDLLWRRTLRSCDKLNSINIFILGPVSSLTLVFLLLFPLQHHRHLFDILLN